nr:immunoglobulin light chain junction region [Macaca mulatta]
CLQGSNTPFTF